MTFCFYNQVRIFIEKVFWKFLSKLIFSRDSSNFYLRDIQNEIEKQFQYISTRNQDISKINSLDITFYVTKKNFLIIWLSSINETLLENIILLCYKNFFKDLKLSNKNLSQYADYEYEKIEKIIFDNHDSKYDGFKKMLEGILGKTQAKIINDRMSNQWKNISDFKWKLTKISDWRNKLAHDSLSFFKQDTLVELNLNNLENDYFAPLKVWFIKMSEIFFNLMEK